ncbi:unnamed protein product [Alopecurus aequalis]
MASPSTSAKTTTFALPRLRDLIEHDDEDDHLVEEEEEDEEDWDIGKRMSRLSIAGSDGGDADDEDDGCRGGDDEDEEEVRSDGAQGEYGSQAWHPYGSPGNLNPPSSASLPGTPERGAPSQSPWGYSKDYASETEAAWWPGGPHDMRRQHHRRQRMMREVWLDRAWQMRKQRQQLGERGNVLVGKGGGESPARGGVAMDIEEVIACKDLGFDLPCDWTVEIPSYAVPNVDTGSSGGNSPASGSWRISSPGDDPKEVKARLKVWAQAVALTSASRLGS